MSRFRSKVLLGLIPRTVLSRDSGRRCRAAGRRCSCPGIRGGGRVRRRRRGRRRRRCRSGCLRHGSDQEVQGKERHHMLMLSRLRCRGGQRRVSYYFVIMETASSMTRNTTVISPSHASVRMVPPLCWNILRKASLGATPSRRA